MCHRNSYRLGHRYECRIFSALYPNVLPNTVRLVLLLLLRRQNRSLSDGDWSAFLSLESHVAEFQTQSIRNEEGLTVWQTIELMSQAITKYSGTREPLNSVQGMVARVLVNSHTLITPTLDPLGLCLSPKSALLNHSCTPNTHIVFSGKSLSLRSLNSIEPGSELTIAYIDTTQVTATRKSELQSRYFFACKCPSCIAGTTNGMPDPTVDSNSSYIDSRALDLESQATKLSPNEAATQLESALERLRRYPTHRQPYANIQQKAFLNALTRQDWLGALKFALEAYLYIEPVHYPSSWHPVRVVKTWVLLKLIMNIAALTHKGDDCVRAIDRLEIDWDIVIVGLWNEVRDGVEMSHGEANPLAEGVKAAGQEMELGAADINIKTKEREWGKIRDLAGRLWSQKVSTA